MTRPGAPFVGFASVGVVDLFIHLCGFLGGWLLVAGPVYQMAIELREESFSREAFEHVSDAVPPPEPVSKWWWLLPPVFYLLSKRRSNAYRTAVFAAMSRDVRAQAVGFVNKATGWMIVAVGAGLIAVKETWELVHLLHLHTAVFWVTIVVMAFLAVGHTVMRLHRADQMIEHPERGVG